MKRYIGKAVAEFPGAFPAYQLHPKVKKEVRKYQNVVNYINT